MRTRMSSRNHPMQPLSPKHQPWFRMQAPDRSVARVNMSRTNVKVIEGGSPTVEQEIVWRGRIEERMSEKIEKLQNAVEHDRFVRRTQRNRGSGYVRDYVKKEMSKADAARAAAAQAQ